METQSRESRSQTRYRFVNFIYQHSQTHGQMGRQTTTTENNFFRSYHWSVSRRNTHCHSSSQRNSISWWTHPSLASRNRTASKEPSWHGETSVDETRDILLVHGRRWSEKPSEHLFVGRVATIFVRSSRMQFSQKKWKIFGRNWLRNVRTRKLSRWK